MEKFITVDYCKRHQKFPTKGDFMDFVKSEPALTKFLRECDQSIEEFKCSKLEEFDSFLETPMIASSKAMFLTSIKLRIKERAEQKKRDEREALKNGLRDEIMREINDEKIATEFSDYLPLDPGLKEKFSAWLIGGLDEEKKQALMKLKEDADKIWNAAQKFNKKLELFEQKL
jgi:hypothetical protein